MTKTSTIKAFLASLLLAAPAANAITIDFEDFDPVGPDPLIDFQHGTVVNSQYDYAEFGNVTITANNIGGGPNLAVAFDSKTPKADTTDDDLVAPFSNPTLGASNPDHILIIQENGDDCSSGTCSDPDDEGTRPAGRINFVFELPINLISLDFFDIENFQGNDEDSDQPGSEILFFDKFGVEMTFADDYFVPGTGGDNTWDRLEFAGVTGIFEIEVNLIGSGAIDNLEYSVVPLPASVWLFGAALLGFIGYSRRTSV